MIFSEEKYPTLEFITEKTCFVLYFQDNESCCEWKELIQKTINGLYERQPELIVKPYRKVEQPKTPNGRFRGEPSRARSSSESQIPSFDSVDKKPHRKRTDTVINTNRGTSSRKDTTLSVSYSAVLTGSHRSRKPTPHIKFGLKDLLSHGKNQTHANVPDKKNSTQEGYLRKKKPSEMRWKRRYFSIIDKGLYYYKTSKDNVPTGCIRLEGSSITVEEKEKDIIIHLTLMNGNVILLGASSKMEASTWVHTLKSC